ncbi:MAG: F0F1 ATP synthase subunit epsilon [Dehalococcoidales bacterium]|jgi:F-type H+-transporting ATPase subunit epsilon|nr:F0F1 ATP synthase subunit epsilon [Dehalococcoidales bacterium]MDD3264535.1 F0F1 ATP synthase subunit epsilon [Dehalococcoidales bacterium]MDD4322377.1 F0F1 ATP synthase subunit epsilon [Dehalococcoidales bacterium]MDD4794025.1 F0F1 ATP synthase subunit epsilon [Dehalococcoidales bacterium]MDD5121765.1 F0F1 ATP synthase subunit epsilon [Dehalococcoidales bacterium]
MSKIKLDIVTPEEAIFSDEIDMLVAPGIEGELGILPHHAPLMTVLGIGELIIRNGNDEQYLAIGGGYLEVQPDRVIVLADAAERAEDIDIARAEAAKEAAQRTMAEKPSGIDSAQAEAALKRSLVRLKVATKRRKRYQEG